jgi:multisubunit Na+/H+ antiporter MnhF subunit
VSIFLSLISMYLLTPSFGLLFIGFSPDLVLPSVVSLAIFVFVFWPLLKNSWPSFHHSESIQLKQGIPSKLRRILSEIVPINTATLVWMSMIVFPAVVSISNFTATETQVTYNISISGGLSLVTYEYTWFHFSGQFFPYINTMFIYSLAGWASLTTSLFWILNLWLGVTTLRFILGKSTKKRVHMLATLTILIYAIPSFLMLMSSLLTGLGIYTIPLPFYPIIMVFVTRFVHPPSQREPITEDMIRIPLRTRVSSFFKRKQTSQEISVIEESENQSDDRSSS